MGLSIGIDGPVGAGKSSVADAVASRLGILHLDTGAMYRALGLTALRQKIDPQDEKAVVKVEEEAKKEKSPVAKLRGKLLYKKSQIRKLEKSAATADAVLAEKLQELENQRRALLSSAEPRLAALYAEHDSMEDEIQKMTEKK